MWVRDFENWDTADSDWMHSSFVRFVVPDLGHAIA